MFSINNRKNLAFQCTAAAAVVLSVFASAAASATDVRIGGMIDTGLKYSYTDSGSGKSKKALTMDSGMLDSSRVSLKVNETISPDLSVGYIGESGVYLDSGELFSEGTLFELGSLFYISHRQYGELWAGRLGTLRTGTTPAGFNIMGKRVSPFGSGWDGHGGSPLYTMPYVGFSVNNAMIYKSPVVNGLQVDIEYAFGGDDDGDENKPNTDRYSGIAITYDANALQLVGVVEYVNEDSSGSSREDQIAVTAGGSYDFESFKLYGWAQYFKGADQIMSLPGIDGYSLFSGADDITGWGMTISAKIPAGHGFIDLSASYLDAERKDQMTAAEEEASGKTLKRYGATAAYEYPLSKSTTAYAALGVYKDRAETFSDGVHVKNPLSGQLFAGIHIDL